MEKSKVGRKKSPDGLSLPKKNTTIKTYVLLKKGKVLNGQKPPSGESTITECGVNYQLLVVTYLSTTMGNSLFQSTTISYEQWRQRRLFQLTGRSPHPHGPYPPSASCIVGIGTVSAQPGIDLATSACEATTLPMRLLGVGRII